MLHASSPGCKHRHRLWREVEAEALVAPTQRAWCARGELLSPPHQGRRRPVNAVTRSLTHKIDVFGLRRAVKEKTEASSEFFGAVKISLTSIPNKAVVAPRRSPTPSSPAAPRHPTSAQQKLLGSRLDIHSFHPFKEKKKNQRSSPKLMKTWSSVIPAPAICIIMRSERRRGGRTGKQTPVSRSSRTRPTAPTAADSSP